MKNTDSNPDNEIKTYNIIRKIFKINNKKFIIASKEKTNKIYYIDFYNINFNKEKNIVIDLTIFKSIIRFLLDKIAFIIIPKYLIMSLSNFIYLIDINTFSILDKIIYYCKEDILKIPRVSRCSFYRYRKIMFNNQISSFIYIEKGNIIIDSNNCYYFQISKNKINLIGKKISTDDPCEYKILKMNNFIIMPKCKITDEKIAIYELNYDKNDINI